jgi:hypothetical protein
MGADVCPTLSVFARFLKHRSYSLARQSTSLAEHGLFGSRIGDNFSRRAARAYRAATLGFSGASSKHERSGRAARGREHT